MQQVTGAIIVGAGPVGMTAALALTRASVPVTVLEAGDALSTESRASTFHPPTLEMLQRLGVADELVSVGLRASRFQYRDRRDGLIAEFDLGVLDRDTRFPFRLQCEQSLLTPIIARHLRDKAGVSVRYGRRVTSVEQVSRATVVVDAATSGGRERYEARWVIGADGSHSAVRRSLGLAFEGLTFPDRYLVVTTSLDLRAVVPGIAYVNYVSDPDEWFVLLRTQREWRAMFPVGLDQPEEELTNDEAVQRRMAGIAPGVQAYPVRHVTLYHVHQRLASSFRAGRVLLCGDAAHINNPLGGMGMNSGIHDAFLLAIELARVWHGDAKESILEDWASDRRRVFVEHVQQSSESNWSAIRESDKSAREAYHAKLKEIAAHPQLMRQYLLNTSMLETVRAILD
jgi:2-polyprenyl-6-methoxyphenol hydroxylase-like FAD-dependent oxidoreductase